MPFGGRFLIRVSDQTTLEGDWQGSLIVIEFLYRAAVDAWYRSDSYQAIVALRTDNATGDVMIVDANHKACCRTQDSSRASPGRLTPHPWLRGRARQPATGS